MISNAYDIIVITVMLVATVAAYCQTVKLDINPHHVSHLDDILLFVAVPAFFAQFILSIVPAIQYKLWLNMASSLTELLQILVQTPWLIDGLRRCSNSKENFVKKPGEWRILTRLGTHELP